MYFVVFFIYKKIYKKKNRYALILFSIKVISAVTLTAYQLSMYLANN